MSEDLLDFKKSQSLTMGVELELQLIDRRTGKAVPDAFVFTKTWSRSSPCSLSTVWMFSPLRTIRVNVSR